MLLLIHTKRKKRRKKIIIIAKGGGKKEVFIVFIEIVVKDHLVLSSFCSYAKNPSHDVQSDDHEAGENADYFAHFGVASMCGYDDIWW